jgi:hypothetical protein
VQVKAKTSAKQALLGVSRHQKLPAPDASDLTAFRCGNPTLAPAAEGRSLICTPPRE